MVSFNFTFDIAVSFEQRVAFELAARIWSAYLTDDVIINLHIASTEGLDGDAVGGAIPIFHDQLYGVYQEYAEADATLSSTTGELSVDQQALSSLQEGNTAAFWLNEQVIESNTNIALTSAQAKALGMTSALSLESGHAWDRGLIDTHTLDGYILVNQNYNWSYEFLREKKAKGKSLDFLSMAMHEIGHNLGFVSGIDGAMELQSLHSGDQEIENFTVLDLFRFSSDSATVHNSDGSVSDVSVGGDSYFSIDGGQTSLADFSTGQQVYLGGDGYQASHWKRLKKAMGIMDPTLAYKERLSLSLLDLQAMDVLGWDIDYSALDSGLDMHQLLAQAETAVAHNLGIESTLFSENEDHNDLYQLGYGALFQQIQAQMLELGYGALFQELEASFEQWRQDGSLLNLGYGTLFQEFETKLYELGYGALFQELEADMFELGYGGLFQMLELGYGVLFQQLDTYFASGTHENAQTGTTAEVVDAYVGSKIEKVYQGGGADDILSGTEQQDRIDGGDGDDFIDGKEGHDVLWGDAGQDIIYGAEGNDSLRGGEGNDLLEGEIGNDELHGDAGHDVLHGDDGEDLLDGGAGKDEVNGGWDNDVLSGGSGDDLLRASAGNDVAVGGDGNDKIEGGSGNDTLYGDRTGIHATENLHALKAQFASQQNANATDDTPVVSVRSSTPNPIRLEAESMALSGQYEIRNLNSDSGYTVRALSNVTGQSTFSGPSGNYMVLVRYLDEDDGNSTISIGLNDSVLDQWTLGQNDDRYYTRTVSQSVYLSTGDALSFRAMPGDSNEYGSADNAYIDYIELIPLDHLQITTLDSPAQGTDTGVNSVGDTAASTAIAFSTSNTLRVEAESMILAGEYSAKDASFASGGQYIENGWSGTGFALTSFAGDTGFYDIVVGYYDESDGISSVTAALNNHELDSWKLDLNLGGELAQASNFTTRTVAKGILLNQNDVFKLTSVQDASELSRLDYVDFIKVAAPTAKTEVAAPQPAENGLLAHWSFDEVIGNRAADAVGAANGLLHNIESTDWRRGAIGNALRFDGTDETFHVSETSQFDTGNNSDFSVAFWTKIEAGPTGEWRNLIFKGTNNYSNGYQNRDFGIYLHPDSNRVHYRISTTEDWNDGGNSQAVLQEEQWYHIAYVKEGSQLSLYINGEEDSSVTLQGSNVDSGGDLWAGNSTASTLDDLRIYSRALTVEDLSELASAWQPGGFDDTIQGGSGNDVAFGGIGRDVIYGDHEDGTDSATFYGAQFFDGSVYMRSQTGTWIDAQNDARRIGGNLVTLNTQAEEQLLQDRYGQETAYWIGINDAEAEGQWEWVSGEAVTYTNWAPGQPDDYGEGQDYGQLNYRDGQWDDNPGMTGAVIKDGVFTSAPTAGIVEIVGSYDDTLFGGSGDDALYGGAGNDALYGESLVSALSEGLVAYWHFDEGSGLSRESVTGAHHGTVVSVSGNSGWTEGLFNGAVDFGNDISHVRIADSDELDITRQITIATWINGDEFQNWDGLVTKGTTATPYTLQIMENGQLGFEANHGTGGVRNSWRSAATLTTGRWHHVAVTYDGAAVRFYIDGQLDENISYAEFQFDTNDEDLVLGADLPGLEEFFDGQMDDTRLYNRALSGTEISKLAEREAETFEYGGSTYLLTSEKVTWTEAQAEAERLGGNLVTVNDWQERKWLNRTFDWDDRLWIGLSDAEQEGNWQWASGEEVSYTYWAAGEPDDYYDQDYAVMNWENGQWADAWNDGEYRWNADIGDWEWEGQYRGIIEIKPPEESQNDVIIAGVGNDTAIGGLGDDIINGSDAVAAGYFEVDQLWGGAGADTFVLGDYNQAYYQGEQDKDYALIKDLDSSDMLQLYGAIEDYTVEQNGPDASLYYQGDLVAIFENATYSAEAISQARFV